MRRGLAATLLLVGTLLATLTSAGAGEQTPGLAEARRRAQEATQAYADAEERLGELDAEIQRLERQARAIEADVAEMEEHLRDIAVERYTHPDLGDDLLGGDLDRAERAAALSRAVTNDDEDIIDTYEAKLADLDALRRDLAERRQEQTDELAALDDANRTLQAELAKLEELERRRLAEEARKREEARQRREAEERRRREAEAAAAAAVAATATTEGSATTTTTTSLPDETEPPVVIADGEWVCPVQGAVSFVDSFGDPRPGGRWHEGVDMMSTRGTPVVAPVDGVVTHRSNAIGGLSFYETGADGKWYYGTHLDSYGATGNVKAGTIVGYVGSSGNAPESAPHLHFEIHVNGVVTNPYPTVAKYC